MAKIRSIAEIAAKWQDVTPGRTAFYKAGVENPKKDWEDETAGAEDRYEAGVQEAITQNRFGKGVREAGTSKWKEGALKKGVDRWGVGVRLAGDAYARGFAPFRDTIDGISLSPRYAKGDPRNIERVREIAEALHNKKISG